MFFLLPVGSLSLLEGLQFLFVPVWCFRTALPRWLVVVTIGNSQLLIPLHRLQGADALDGSKTRVDEWVVFAVWGEGVVGLVSQRGTVSVHLVEGLWNVDHRVLIQGDGIPVQGPIPSVYLGSTVGNTTNSECVMRTPL